MKQYFYCDGLTMLSTEVSLGTITACTLDSEWQQGEFYHRNYKHTVNVTIPSALPTDLTVYLYSNIYDCPAFSSCVTYDLGFTITIPAGSTTGSTSVTCYDESYQDYGAGGQEYEYLEVTGTTLRDQPTLPTGCTLEEPLDCELAITDYVVTNPTVRGANDGSIAVTISGATGSTVTYKINGVTRTTSGAATGYTYTGLAGGSYDVFVQEGDCYDFENDITVLDGDFRTGDFTITTPADISAAHNPIVVNVGTAVNNSVIPKNAKLKFTVENVEIEDGTNIVFAFTNPKIYNQTFYAKTFPNRNNYFLATDITDADGNVQGTNTYLEIAQSLAESLSKDVFISQNYDIKVNDDDVYLYAKQDGSKYNLNSTNVFIRDASGTDITTGITKTVVASGTDYYDGGIVDNYSVYSELYLNDDVSIQYPSTGNTLNYNKISELSIPFQTTNVHLFDFSEVLKNYVSTSKPFYDFTGYTTQPMMMRPFFVKFGETYPIVSNSNTIKKRYKTKSDMKWVINSALDYFDANTMADYIGDDRKFLTNSPNPKQIQRNQNEYLYFIIESTLDKSTALYGDIYFYDGTSITDYKFFDIFTITGGISRDHTGGVLMLNLSYDKLGLEDIEYSGSTVRKIKYVDVHVDYNLSGTTWTGFTETKRYAFNINEQARKFGVLFQNKLGTYDTFDFIGIKETILDRTYGEYTVNSTPNYAGAYQQGFKNKAVYNTRVTKRIVANTGYINQDHLHWLQELLMSNNVYDYTETNQHYLKIIDHKYLESSQDDVYDMEVTFEQTIFENNVSI